jgi:hypothetical protein
VVSVRTIVGVRGGAVASEQTVANARGLGRLIAERGWVLLSGGRNAGVMAAASAGAKEAGGLVVGILPDDDIARAAPGLDIAIPTGMGDARNVINVLASRVVVALPGGAGTVSEVALALKNGRPVIMLGFPLGVPFTAYYERGQLMDASTPDEVVEIIERLISEDAS